MFWRKSKPLSIKAQARIVSWNMILNFIAGLIMALILIFLLSKFKLIVSDPIFLSVFSLTILSTFGFWHGFLTHNFHKGYIGLVYHTSTIILYFFQFSMNFEKLIFTSESTSDLIFKLFIRILISIPLITSILNLFCIYLLKKEKVWFEKKKNLINK